MTLPWVTASVRGGLHSGYGRASVFLTPKRFLDVDDLQQILQLVPHGDVKRSTGSPDTFFRSAACVPEILLLEVSLSRFTNKLDRVWSCF